MYVQVGNPFMERDSTMSLEAVVIVVTLRESIPRISSTTSSFLLVIIKTSTSFLIACSA